MTKTQQPELPALPDTPYDLHYEWPDDEDGFGGSEVIGENGYTADQMRAYAQAAVLADRESLLSNMDHAVLRMPLEAAMSGALAQHQFYSRVQSLLDRIISGERVSRKVVAWRYMPSPTWGEYVITQDPKVAEDARACGIEVEELTVGATSKEATR